MFNFTNLFLSEVKLLDRAIRLASKDFNALQANIRKGAPLLKAQSDATLFPEQIMTRACLAPQS